MYTTTAMQLPNERLPKLVYKELLNLNDKNTLAYKYPQHINDIPADKGWIICLMIPMHYTYKLSNTLHLYAIMSETVDQLDVLHSSV